MSVSELRDIKNHTFRIYFQVTVFKMWLLSVIEGSCVCRKEKHDQCVEFEDFTAVTSGMLCHVVRLKHTDILKELAASIIRVGSRFV